MSFQFRIYDSTTNDIANVLYALENLTESITGEIKCLSVEYKTRTEQGDIIKGFIASISDDTEQVV